jgi:hypothetical protein
MGSAAQRIVNEEFERHSQIERHLALLRKITAEK